MPNIKLTSGQISRAIVALAAVLAGSLLAAEVERAEGEGVGAQNEVLIPAAPGPITGVEAPRTGDVSFTEAEFVVPVLRRPDLKLPDPPPIDVEAWREKARSWLGDGVPPAPTGELRAEPPTISREAATFDAPSIEVPVLERPALPAPPAVR